MLSKSTISFLLYKLVNRPHLILGLVFLIVLQPIALILRVFGYDPLRQSQKERKKISYREIKKDYKIDLTRIF